MIQPVYYEASCDHPGCDRTEEHENIFRLYDELRANGWQQGVKLDGQCAKRGGKDYCPEHRRGPT